MDQRPKCKARHYKPLKGKTLFDINHINIFFDPTLKSNESKKAYFYLFVYFLMYSMLSIVDLQEYLKRVDLHLAFVQDSGICQSG